MIKESTVLYNKTTNNELKAERLKIMKTNIKEKKVLTLQRKYTVAACVG